MDTKRLAKIIKLIVEQELKKQMPLLVKEGIQQFLNENSDNTSVIKEDIHVDDPFSLANSMLDEMQTKPVNKQIPPKKVFTKNPILNEILNSTKPFSQTERMGGSSDYQTVGFEGNLAAGGVDALQQQMASKLGLNAPVNSSGASPNGLGVQTKFDHINKALNRDYSALVKKFKN